MNRRQFTQSLAALAAAPTLPAGALAKAAPAVHLSQPPYCWAAFIARVHDKASPAMFKRQLGLSDDMAQNVFDTLLRERVITRPNAMGISQTVTPFKRSVDQMIRFQGRQTSTIKPDQAPKAAKSNPTVKTDKHLLDDSNSINQEVAKVSDDIELANPPAKPVLPEDGEGSNQLD